MIIARADIFSYDVPLVRATAESLALTLASTTQSIVVELI